MLDEAAEGGQCPSGVCWQVTRVQLPSIFWAVMVSIIRRFWSPLEWAPKVMSPYTVSRATSAVRNWRRSMRPVLVVSRPQVARTAA